MNKKGFTLIEVVMIIVILGIIMPGIMLYFITGVKDSAIPQKRTTAVFLAEALMEEIKSKQWDENTGVITFDSTCSNASAVLGADVGETRINFDDIDDFNLVAGVSPPQNSQGASLGTAYQSFSQTVVVIYVAATDLDTSVVGSTCYKRISVSITDTTSNETISLISLMTYY